MPILKIILCLFVAGLFTGCSPKVDDLEAFRRGDVVAWAVESTLPEQSFLSGQDQDCGQAFSSVNGQIQVSLNRAGDQDIAFWWGGATTENEKKKQIMASGTSLEYKIRTKLMDSDRLIIDVDQDGDEIRSVFGQDKNIKNKIFLLSQKYVGSDPDKLKFYSFFSKDRESVPLNLCSASSYKKYVDLMKSKNELRTSEVKSALSYVLDKKWSDGNKNCDFGGGSYQVFSKSLPLGYGIYINGIKPVDIMVPHDFDYKEMGPTKFVLTSKLGVGSNLSSLGLSAFNDPYMLQSRTVYEVSLINPNRIEITTKRYHLDANYAFKNQVVYSDSESTSFGILCE